MNVFFDVEVAIDSHNEEGDSCGDDGGVETDKMNQA